MTTIEQQPVEDRVVDYETALSMLPEGGSIHTFRNPNGMLLGADHDRTLLILLIEKYGVQQTTGMAKGMNHGLVLFDKLGPLFIETVASEPSP